MSNSERSSVPKPITRLQGLLGERFIDGDVIAAVELVKNSYDAGATETKKAIFGNIKDFGDEEIVMRDNSVGMNLDAILYHFLGLSGSFC